MTGQIAPLHADIRWAVLEGSRNRGILSIKTFALQMAAGNKLLDWLWSYEPFEAHFATTRPKIKPDEADIGAFEGASEHADHQRMVLCLLATFRLWRLRIEGALRSPGQGLEALAKWEEEVAPLSVLSPQTMSVAIQTVLGSVGAPAVALCKFKNYTTRQLALSAAWNASWDMMFLRQMRDSQLGMNLYNEQGLPTMLLTFDKHLAAASREITGAFVHFQTNGPRLHGAFRDPRKGLRREVLSDERIMERLHVWLGQVAEGQVGRMNFIPSESRQELQEAIERELLDLGLT